VATEWAVTTPAGEVRLSDLTLDVLIQLEEQTGVEWWSIAAHPFRKAIIAQSVYLACCEHIGCEPKKLVLRDLVEIFVQVEDDLPTVFEGGIPKLVGESETTG